MSEEIVVAFAPFGTKCFWTGKDWSLDRKQARIYSAENAARLVESFNAQRAARRHALALERAIAIKAAKRAERAALVRFGLQAFGLAFLAALVIATLAGV